MTTLLIVFAVALAATLVLAAFLTPAHWWRRPNLKALAVLALGTWGIGSLLLALHPEPAQASTAPASLLTATTPTTIASYVVFEDLNLRASPGIHARRLALVRAGATVTTTGLREGDWWQVRSSGAGEGWVSSLWLRRGEEMRR